eukprot:UN02512
MFQRFALRYVASNTTLRTINSTKIIQPYHFMKSSFNTTTFPKQQQLQLFTKPSSLLPTFHRYKHKTTTPLMFSATSAVYGLTNQVSYMSTSSDNNNNNRKQGDVPNTLEFDPSIPPQVQKSDKEWLTELGTNAYRVLRLAGTEQRGVGYTDFDEPNGVYRCKGCKNKLFYSDHKFHSGCGWPAFDNCIPGSILTRIDPDGHRTEIVCAGCHSHLGHVFKGERFTKSNVRHCVNSCCLEFDKE